MSNAHTDAVETLLDPLTVSVYVTRPPSNVTGAYVVLHPDQGLTSPTALDLVSDRRSFTFQTTCVANSPDGAQDIAAAVDTLLLDRAPAVAGRTTSPIRKTQTLPVDRDDDLPTPLYIARDLWSFVSISA